MKKKYWLVITIIVFVVVGFYFYLNYYSSKKESMPNVKTNELKNNEGGRDSGSIPLEKPPFLTQ
jgi:hypothetical protein